MKKLYRGASADARRAERRERLIASAVTLYAAGGFHDTSVKAVCQGAGLTERYFYESFASSEELLVEAFEHELEKLFEHVAQSSHDGARSLPLLVSRYFDGLRRNPAATRLFLVEIPGVSARSDAVFSRALDRFGALLLSTAGTSSGSRNPLTVRGVIGGVHQIALDWIAVNFETPQSHIVAAAMDLCAILEERRPPTPLRSA